MPAEIPAPSKIRRGSAGDYYYFDGVNPMTILTGGVGTDLNQIAGALTTYTITTAEWDNIQNYLLARKVVFDRLAACETCPSEGGLESADDLDTLIENEAGP